MPEAWKGTMRIGDGPWIPVTNLEITFERTPPRTFIVDEVELVTAAREDALLRRVGVDPDRVIDGETVQAKRKEIEGG